MSHSPQRKEKDCLNCGAIVQGHYCQECGQENIEPKETFWHMVTHFFYDITHFDGSFFITVKDLLLKPAFLTKEYIKGRRKKYLHPVRMYVFTSAVFFLIFFSFFGIKESKIPDSENGPPIAGALIHAKDEALKNAKSKEDSMTIQAAAKVFKINDSTESTDVRGQNKKDNKTRKGFNISFSNAVLQYSSEEEYDSVQGKLPVKERDNWFVGLLTKKSISLNRRYKYDEEAIVTKLLEKFLHSLPYLLFVSLPLYALFLKMLYFRRKQFYFADHGVFLLHLYIFTFLFMLLYFALDKINGALHWGVIDIIQLLLLLIGIFYALKAMRNFYEQGWGKTILKFSLLNILCIVTAAFLFVLFLFLSFYQV